jgi:hypothetical protein
VQFALAQDESHNVVLVDASLREYFANAVTMLRVGHATSPKNVYAEAVSAHICGAQLKMSGACDLTYQAAIDSVGRAHVMAVTGRPVPTTAGTRQIALQPVISSQ